MDCSTTSKSALAALWRLASQPDTALDALTLTGTEPALPSSFAVGTAAQASIAAAALAAAELWRLRTGSYTVAIRIGASPSSLGPTTMRSVRIH